MCTYTTGCNHCVDRRFLQSAFILQILCKILTFVLKNDRQKKKICETNEDIYGNSSKIDELTTAISMMSDDIIKLVRGQSCIQDLLKTIHALQI